MHSGARFSSGSSEIFIDETVVEPDRILAPYQSEPVFTSEEMRQRVKCSEHNTCDLVRLIPVSVDGALPSEGDAIQVFLRVRPPGIGDNRSHQALAVDKTRNAVILNSKPNPKVFSFDQVGDVDIQQNTVFSEVGKKLIESCVQGYNGTIFAYGQTGSGKTYTMIGPSEDCTNFQHEHRGLIPRSFEYLFDLVNRERKIHGNAKQFLCRCSFLEIYQEHIFDLLDTASPNLHLHENMKKGVFVDSLTERTIANANEAYQVLVNGWQNRRVAATSMNRESSRGHAVFSLQIESKEERDGIHSVRMSQLNLVDLAGSERQKDTKSDGMRLKEAGSINKSLSVLGNVINALVDKAHGKSRFIPYRDSKLTFLLRDSLGGNAKTIIVACVHAGANCFGETLSTLMFAQRVKMIKNKAIVNEDMSGNVMQLHIEIRKLKELVSQYEVRGVSNIPDHDDRVDDTEWKKNFYEAMLFVETLMAEKKVQQEFIKDFKNVLKKKDKNCQTLQMIIKFRESSIKKLESTKNDSNEDECIKELKQELAVVREDSEQRAQMAEQMMENRLLKAKLQQLHASEHVSLCRDKKETLHAAFQELLKTKQTATVKVSNPRASNSAACTELLKNRIEKLQDEIDTLKKCQKEERSTAELKHLATEADLVASKKMVEELERSLQVKGLISDINQRQLNTIHTNTIRVMTTPTSTANNCYKLRNRIVPLTTEDLDSPAEIDLYASMEEGIMEEKIPSMMADAATQALTDEIAELMSINSSSQQRIDEYELAMIHHQKQVTQLEHQVEQLNQILTKEREEWSTEESRLTESEKSLKEALAFSSVDSSASKSEVTDLRIISRQMERELTDQKRKYKELADRNEAVSFLETKIMQLGLSLDKLTGELDDMSKERDQLQDQVETTEETVHFQEQCIIDLETSLKLAEEQKEKSQSELQSFVQSQLVLQEQMDKLKVQIEQEDEEQSKQILHYMEEASKATAANDRLQNILDAQDQNVELLKKELNEMKASVDMCEKTKAADKEAIQKLVASVQDLKTKCAESENERQHLSAQLDSQLLVCDDLQGVNDHYNSTLESMQSQLNSLAQEKEDEKLKHEFELSNQSENLDSLMESYSKMEKELTEAYAQIENLKKHEHDLKMKSKDEMRQLEITHSRAIVQNECEKEETSFLRDEQSKLKQMLEELEHSCSSKNQEIESLKIQMLKIEDSTSSSASLYEERISMLLNDVAAKAAENERLHSGKDIVVKKQAETIDDLEQRLATILALTNGYEEDVKRLKDIAHHDNASVTALESEIEILKEANAKLSKENADLVGHNNHKQKIQYHTQVKEQNIALIQENARLKGELAKYMLPKSPLSVLKQRNEKENICKHNNLFDS